MDSRVAIATLAYGGWYPRGVARQIQKFAEVSPGFQHVSFVNVLPEGAPKRVEENGVDYTAYCAKPFVLQEATRNADIVLLLDASIYPIQHIQPLIDHIHRHGYLFVAAGFTVGEWASDEALKYFNVKRDDMMSRPDLLSGCVGLDMRVTKARCLLKEWRAAWPTFPGPHSNLYSADQTYSYRNLGTASKDPRVRGHRHDQTALSILAHIYGMTEFVQMPRFLAYVGTEITQETALIVHGM